MPRGRSSEGYSMSRYKTDGGGTDSVGIGKSPSGIFRNQVEVRFDYIKFNQAVDSTKRAYADSLRELKQNKQVKVVNGVAAQRFRVPDEWKSIVKWRVNEIAKTTSLKMQDAIIEKIGGRIETGRMKGSVYRRTEKPSAGVVISRAGWINLFYKYFGFQEEGTSTGIKPMRSMLKGAIVGRNYSGQELVKMSRELRTRKKGPVGR